MTCINYISWERRGDGKHPQDEDEKRGEKEEGRKRKSERKNEDNEAINLILGCKNDQARFLQRPKAFDAFST